MTRGDIPEDRRSCLQRLRYQFGAARTEMRPVFQCIEAHEWLRRGDSALQKREEGRVWMI